MLKPRDCQEELAKLSSLRDEAYSRQDAALYAVMCQRLGFNKFEDDNDLYGRGVIILDQDYIDTSKPGNEVFRPRLLSGAELSLLPETDVRKYRPQLLKIKH